MGTSKHGKIYHYEYEKDLSYKPASAYVIIETDDGDLYMSPSSNDQIVIKSEDEGETWSGALYSSDGDATIFQLYYDRDGGKICGVDGILGDTGCGHIFTIDLSDDSVDSDLISTAAEPLFSVFEWNSKICIAGAYSRGSAPNETVGFFVQDFPFTFFDSEGSGEDWAGKTFKCGHGTVVGNYFYWTYSHEDLSQAELWRYEMTADAWSILKQCGEGTEVPDNFDLRGMCYDDSDILYFIIDDNGTNTLFTYSITGTTLTDTGIECNISIMLEGSCKETTQSPYEYEKAFDIVDSIVYKINRGFSSFLKVQDLGFSGKTIIAITDSYLFTSDSELYKYVDYC